MLRYLSISSKLKWAVLSGAVVVLAGGIVLAYAATSGTQQSDTPVQAGISKDTIVSTFGQDAMASSTLSGSSWPAELISSGLAQVQPSRDGVVTDWSVRVGQYVSAGQTLGHLSPPPNTPDLVNMLADRKQAAAQAQAEATLADTYSATEQARFKALGDSISDTGASSSADSTYTALAQLRQVAQLKQQALRSFIERAFANQVTTVTNFSDWRYVRYGGLSRSLYGVRSSSVQNDFESAMISLSSALKSQSDAPIDNATEYFALAVRLSTLSLSGPDTDGFKTQAATDQKDFLDMLADYRAALADVSDKETTYKLDIAEKSSSLEKDRGTAHAAALAAEASYETVRAQIYGGAAIVAPRSGTISAIYKKTGDLVSPDMVLAVVADSNSSSMIVRMHIPSDIRRPVVGDDVAVVRPGFPQDARHARLVGIGTSLDDSGTYMADALLTNAPDWPAGSSVRVLQPQETNTHTIPSSALWWSDKGDPVVWMISPAGRIYAHKIAVGRSLGTSIEVYSGLKMGDSYITKSSPDIHEDMMLSELIGNTSADTQTSTDSKDTSGTKGMDPNMPGMEM